MKAQVLMEEMKKWHELHVMSPKFEKNNYQPIQILPELDIVLTHAECVVLYFTTLYYRKLFLLPALGFLNVVISVMLCSHYVS